MNKNILLFLLFNWLWIFQITGQTINYTIVNNPPSQVAEWIKDPQPFSIQITSPSAMTGIRVITEVKKSGATVVTTNSSSVFPVSLNAGLNLFKGEDVWNPFCFNIDYSNVDVTSGQLKAGDYEMCLWMLNDQFQQVGNISCHNFKVTQFSEPTLIFPQDEWTGTQADASNIIFRWSSVIPNYPSVVNYTLEIFEATEGMSQLQALASPPIVQEVLTQQNMYIWQDASTKIYQRINATDTAYKYYWRVKAEDITTNYPVGCKDGLNKGYSEIRQFTVFTSPLPIIITNSKKDTTEAETKINLDDRPADPKDSARISYAEPILQEPIRAHKVSAKPDDGVKLEWKEVTPTYPTPVTYELEIFDLSKKDSSRVLRKELKSMNSFEWKSFEEKLEDQTFEWRVRSLDTLKKPIGSKHADLKGFSQTERFTIEGTVLKEPKLTSPENEASVGKDAIENGVELKWDEVTSISNLNLKYKIQLYKKGDDKKKDSLLLTQTLDSIGYTWKPISSEKIEYKWRVQLQDSTGKPVGVKSGKEKGYSDYFTFTIDTAYVADTDTVTDCDGKKTVVTNEGKEKSVDAKNLKNKFLKINEFTMLVTEVTGSSEALSGKGAITVSWLKTPVAVEFHNLVVNTSTLTVTSGNVFAERDEFGEDIPTYLGSASDEEVDTTHNNTKIDTAQVIKLFSKLKKSKLKLVKDQDLKANIEKSKSGYTPKLPLGINDFFGYTIVVSEMKFTPEKNTLVGVAILPIVKNGGESILSFAATDIQFGASSPSKSGGKLALLNDFNIVDPDSNSYGITFAAKDDDKPMTYIEWDCKGFKSLQATVDVSFPRSWLTPVPSDDEEESDSAKVVGRASVEITNLKDWMLTLSLGACSINGLDGVELKVDKMVFDHSDTKNPDGLEFPENWDGTTKEDFQGFFLQAAEIKLPKFYNKSTDSSSIAIGLENFIISKQGLSGKLNVGTEDSPILSLESGSVGDFKASIEKVEIEILNKSITTANVEGKIVLPISTSTPEKPNTLKYMAKWEKATEDRGSKIQMVITAESIETQLFDGAKLALLESSALELTYTKGKTKKDKGITTMDVKLAGNFSISKKVGGNINATFEMDFENLGFTYDNSKKTKKFEFYKATFAFASPQKKLAGFPISFKHIEIVNDEVAETGFESSAGLKMQIDINLTNDIGGSTTFKIRGGIKKIDNINKPSLIGVQIDSVGIKAKLAAVDLEGSLTFYRNDPVFGDGFRGMAKANFEKVGMLKATVLFGKTMDSETTPSYRYWYADAFFIAKKAVPMIGTLGLKGAGVGAWHNMAADTSNHMKVDDVANALGDSSASSSGSIFIPNNSIVFGFRIMGVLANVNSEKTFNGEITFSAAFNTSGGINYLSLGGKGFIGAEIKKRHTAPMRASLLAYYDFTQGVFDLNVAVGIKYPLTGKALIQTVQDATLSLNVNEKERINNQAKWSLTVGTPRIPNKITFMSLNTWAYFRTGNNLVVNNSFQPQTMSGLRAINPSFSAVPEPTGNDAKAGKGFDFGIGFNMKGDLSFGKGKFNGGFSLGAEVNCSMTQYNALHSCVTDKFNYWYARGGLAVYASVYLRYKKWLDIYLGLAAMMQAGAPEPIWIKGKAAVKLRIKLGIIKLKIKATVPFKYGEVCPKDNDDGKGDENDDDNEEEEE